MFKTLLAPVFPGIVLLDRKAAFPSVLHQYLFFVLHAMKLPSNSVQAIQFLYMNSEAIIKFYGMTEYSIKIKRGIRQGCPLSGTLWAILF